MNKLNIKTVGFKNSSRILVICYTVELNSKPKVWTQLPVVTNAIAPTTKPLPPCFALGKRKWMLHSVWSLHVNIHYSCIFVRRWDVLTECFDCGASHLKRGLDRKCPCWVFIAFFFFCVVALFWSSFNVEVLYESKGA